MWKQGVLLVTFVLFIATGWFYGTLICTSFQKVIFPMSENSVRHPHVNIPNPYDDMDLWNMPAKVPFNDEQRLYLTEVLSAMIKVISGSSPLEVEEKRILGPGQFFWPKDPAAPTRISKSYFGTNFRVTGIAARLERRSPEEPWYRATLVVRPPNFPDGVYAMQLEPSVFNDFKLEAVTQEDRMDERIKSPLLFSFRHRKVEDLVLRIEARNDVGSVDDSYPSSFHKIELTHVRSQKAAR